MEIFPAIDLRDGNVVMLTQGDYDRMDVYSNDPVEIARTFKDVGAKNLHVVDLDGAKDGRLMNFDSIKKIMVEGGLFVQVGGGIRDEERIRQYLDIGVNRVILGTIAVQDFSFVEQMVKKYKEKIAVGVDAKDGYVAVEGWRETTNVSSLEFCQRLEDVGVQTVIYTDIIKDGKLSGTNLEVYKTLSTRDVKVVASGGISYEHEITELRSMNLYAAIVGKALYTGMLDLKNVLRLASGKQEA